MRVLHLLIALLAISFTIETKAVTTKCDRIKVAFSENWFPVSFLEPGDSSQMAGLAYDIFSQLAAINNIELEIVNPIPWKRALLWMDQGKIDSISGHYWSEPRNQKWFISAPFLKMMLGYFTFTR